MREGAHILPRIERLESLIEFARGAAANIFAGPIVANEAGAAAFPLSDTPGSHAQIFVLSHRSIWTKKNGVPGTPGVPVLKANEVIASTAGPAGVLCRTTYSDPTWRLGVPDIHIGGVGANNENDGFTALTPLASGAELGRRWGRRNLVRGNPVDALSTINIHIHTSILTPDYLEIDAVAALGTVVNVIGEGTTVLLAGNLDAIGGFTAQVPGAAAGGTAAMIKVGATVWAGFIGDRIRFPVTGATAAILKDLGAGSARVNQPSIDGRASTFGTPTLVSPANGTAFVVESLVSVNWGNVHLTNESGDIALNFGTGLVNVFDINGAGQGVNGPGTFGPIVDGPGLFQMALFLYSCTFDVQIGLPKNVAYCSCIARGGINFANPEVASGNWLSGAVVQTAISVSYAGIVGTPIGSDLGLGTFSTSPYFQGTALLLWGDGFMNDVAVFDAPGAGGVNPGGHAISVGGGTSSGVSGSNWKTRAKVWGNGSAGFGIHVASNCSFSYNASVSAPAPNVTGAGGDFQLGVTASSWFFQVATATYQPAAGPLANTWANLAAVQPGGFGGSAHEPDRNAHLVAESLS